MIKRDFPRTSAMASLDGNLLISKDVYKGTTVVDGKLTLSNPSEIGIQPILFGS